MSPIPILVSFMKFPDRIRDRAHIAALRGFVVCALLLGTSVAHGADHRFRLATIAPKDSAFDESLKRMRQAWQKVSRGAVELDIYSGSSQGGDAAIVQRMKIDQLQGALLTGVGLSEIEPTVAGLQSIPMMFRSLEEVDYIGEKLKPELEERLRDKGFIVLFWTDTGWVRFFTKTPVITPSDMRKMKLFAWAGNNSQVGIMRKAGFNAVPLETSDIKTSLQTDLISAVPMPPLAANFGQIYGSAPNMLDLNWAPLIGAAVVTTKAWNRLPPELQTALKAAAKGPGEEIKKAGRQQNDDAVKVMQTKGKLVVHPVPPSALAEWRQLAETVYPDIRGTIVPAAIFDRVKALLEEYRIQHPEQN